jgi:hypothetical protein
LAADLEKITQMDSVGCDREVFRKYSMKESILGRFRGKIYFGFKEIREFRKRGCGRVGGEE